MKFLGRRLEQVQPDCPSAGPAVFPFRRRLPENEGIAGVKFSELKAIGHNIADSLASGIGLMIGVYEMDVFGEASKSPERYILVDFITGTSTGGQPSKSLARAISLYAGALSDLCRRHGLTSDAFRELTARYEVTSRGTRFIVTVQGQNGRRSIDEYRGIPGKRVMVRDRLGRIRTRRHQVPPN